MKNLYVIVLLISIGLTASSQQYGWKDISANIPDFPYDSVSSYTDVFFINDNEGWITTNHGYNDTAAILHTMDGGETFEVQTTLYSCNAIHMLNNNVGYAGGKSGFVYKTFDGGENWNHYGSISTTLADISFPPVGDTGYCCGINGNIWSIYSTGITKMTSNVYGNLSGISFPINSEEGWVVGGDVIRHYSSNSWNGDQDYPSGGYNAIYMLDSLNGWVVGDGGIIAHTTDGQNWFEQINPNPQQNTFYSVFFLNEDEGWAVGLSWVIEHTIDGGTNWSIQNIGSLYEPAFIDIHFTSSSCGYVVGNNKTIMKYTEVSGIADDGLEELAFEVYPNPCRDKIQITKFKTQTNSKLEIIDLHGRVVYEEERGRMGEGEISVDVSHLPAGIYLVKLQTENAVGVQKLIKR